MSWARLSSRVAALERASRDDADGTVVIDLFGGFNNNFGRASCGEMEWLIEPGETMEDYRRRVIADAKEAGATGSNTIVFHMGAKNGARRHGEYF